MFWMKKMAVLVVLTALVGGGVLAGVGLQSKGVAQATVPRPADPQTSPDDPDAALKRLNKQIEDLRKQRELLGAKEMDLFAEKARLEETAKAKAAAEAVAGLGKDIAVVVENGKPSEYRIYEAVNGKIAELSCSDLDMLTTYLRRTFSDPKGPKKLRIGADKEQSYEHLREVFAACASAGYKTTSFSHDRPVGYFHRYAKTYDAQMLGYYQALTMGLEEAKTKDARLSLSPGNIDLQQYAPKKP